MVFDWLKQPKKSLAQIEKELQEVKSTQPVDIKDIEDFIKLINTAKDIDCAFSLFLALDIGNFALESSNFKDIKLLKPNKTQEERLVITHTNALLTIDTSIDTKNITAIEFTLKFDTDKLIHNEED